MNDQQLCDFLFEITPTNITQTVKTKTTISSQKSILIKLGNKQAKCKSLGQTVSINMEVLYSKTLNKFCPIKGIIKVYDVNKDGIQMISCVGAFNTQDLLSDKPKTTKLQRDIGPCKVYLTFKVQKLQPQPLHPPPSIQPSKKQPHKSKQLDSIKVPQLNQSTLKSDHKKFIKPSQPSDPQSHLQTSIPYLINDSTDNIHDISKCSQYSDDPRKNQRQILGQQLVQQRRKNKSLQQKLQKLTIKLQLLRKTLTQKNNQLRIYYQNFKNFTTGLQCDSKGQYIFQMNQRKRQVSLRYKPTIKFKQIFEEFIAFIIKKMSQYITTTSSTDKPSDDQLQLSKFTTKHYILQSQHKKSIDQNNKLINQLLKIKQQLNLKKLQLSHKQNIIKNHIQQINYLQNQFQILSDSKKQIEGLNQYLQQRDTQMQSIILSKQTTIQTLQKTLTKTDQQLHLHQQKSTKFTKVIDNLQLTIQQMKQQHANLSQTIQGYRLKFGDLKQAKDKALQRQIKQCLRWIDQQNRQQQLSFEDTTLTFSQTPAVTSIMRSIGQIQNMPLQQISLIRKQVIGVLKRLDQFVAKNSLGGIPS